MVPACNAEGADVAITLVYVKDTSKEGGGIHPKGAKIFEPDSCSSHQDYHCSCFSNRWRSHQMNVKIVFLNSVIEKEAYIEQPQRFVIHEKESHVCRLSKPCRHLEHGTPGSMDT